MSCAGSSLVDLSTTKPTVDRGYYDQRDETEPDNVAIADLVDATLVAMTPFTSPITTLRLSS